MGFHNDEQTFVYSYCQNGSARTQTNPIMFFFLSTKVFKMIHKIRQSSILVDLNTKTLLVLQKNSSYAKNKNKRKKLRLVRVGFEPETSRTRGERSATVPKVATA